MGRGQIGVVRVGRTPAVTGEETAELLRPLRERHRDFHVSVEQCWPAELAGRLLRVELELAMGRVLEGGDGLAATARRRSSGSWAPRVLLRLRSGAAIRSERSRS